MGGKLSGLRNILYILEVLQSSKILVDAEESILWDVCEMSDKWQMGHLPESWQEAPQSLGVPWSSQFKTGVLLGFHSTLTEIRELTLPSSGTIQIVPQFIL